ncbi:MAG TPA: aminotransferase class IV [Vicinamibacteria bacterium]|nr:aminotransferase class IV [Vicinamibacteria bacterium]
MGFFASVNGEIVPAEEARVSVLDNGFTFGDGVYETLRTYAGRPFRLDRHLQRLRGSAARLGIGLPLGDGELARRLDALLSRAANPESYVRLIVTRGVGDISYAFERVQGPTVVMAVKPYQPYPERHFREGVDVIVSSVRRNHPLSLDPAIKSCNLLNNILAVREAQARGAAEAILLNHAGDVAEGASTNVFAVRRGAVLTPPLDAGILAGITREVVIEVGGRRGLAVREEPLALDALVGADEAFLTSTTRELAPVRSLDGRPIGGGRPGPVTLDLLAAFREEAARGTS